MEHFSVCTYNNGMSLGTTLKNTTRGVLSIGSAASAMLCMNSLPARAVEQPSAALLKSTLLSSKRSPNFPVQTISLAQNEIAAILAASHADLKTVQIVNDSSLKAEDKALRLRTIEEQTWKAFAALLPNSAKGTYTQEKYNAFLDGGLQSIASESHLFVNKRFTVSADNVTYTRIGFFNITTRDQTECAPWGKKFLRSRNYIEDTNPVLGGIGLSSNGDLEGDLGMTIGTTTFLQKKVLLEAIENIRTCYDEVKTERWFIAPNAYNDTIQNSFQPKETGIRVAHLEVLQSLQKRGVTYDAMEQTVGDHEDGHAARSTEDNSVSTATLARLNTADDVWRCHRNNGIHSELFAFLSALKNGPDKLFALHEILENAHHCVTAVNGGPFTSYTHNIGAYTLVELCKQELLEHPNRYGFAPPLFNNQEAAAIRYLNELKDKPQLTDFCDAVKTRYEKIQDQDLTDPIYFKAPFKLDPPTDMRTVYYPIAFVGTLGLLFGAARLGSMFRKRKDSTAR